jgi:hypothetical protein
VLERFWGVREADVAAGFLERLLCQGLWGRLAGILVCAMRFEVEVYFDCWLAMFASWDGFES